MKRRISQKRKLALDQLAKAYKNKLYEGRTYAVLGVQMAYGAKVGSLRRYARNWLLATGELPTGLHEIPYPTNSSQTQWNSDEVDFDALAKEEA